MRLLDVRGLSVSYGDTGVLHDVRLHVDAGEALVVLGGSGSGKSTLLRAVLGLVPAPGRVDAATLAFDGRDLRDPAVLRAVRGHDVGTVFQDPALALTPLRRVASLVTEVTGDAARVRPLLADSGFADPGPVAARRCHELSGGMAQRVGLALAVADDPRLLLADEPTTALDGPAREELVGRLRSRVRDGGAVLLVTHDVGVAAALADRVVVLERGRVVEQGPPARVLGAPSSDAAVSLVRDVPWSLPPRTRSAAAGKPVLEVRDLRKRYAEPVLDGLDLAIGEGEVVGLAGRSGGGKTTLLRCLVGLERPDGGSVAIGGRAPGRSGAWGRWGRRRGTGWSAVRRDVQLVPQDPRAALNPFRTAARLVADPLDFHRIGTRAERRDRAEELLERVGMSGYGGRYPHELSTGQCQRVAIARALAVRPRLLVADEPASALDVTLQAGVLALLSDLVEAEGMAGLVVSHDLHVLERLADRIAVLDGGRVVEDVPTPDLRDRARHPATRTLLAAYPADPLAATAG